MQHAKLLPHRMLSFVIGILIAASFVSSVAAQSARPTNTFYLSPQAGISSYVGDHGKSFFDFDGAFPYSAGAELGYQFNVPLSLGLAYNLGRYPAINTGEAGVRHSADFMLRYLIGRSTGVAPFLQVGAHATFGEADIFGTGEREQKVAFGPLVGLGLDIPVGNRVSLFFQGTTRAAFPDDASDGREGDRSGSFDLLSTIGTGLKINFKSAARPPRVIAIDVPSRLEAGEVGTFQATMSGEATRPVEYRWEWGDGTTSSGLTVTHSFATPGTYTVRFTASNRAGSDSETASVTVVPRKMAPQISGITATPNVPDTQTQVQFSATVRGDAPLNYRWDFGDGTTASSASPSHTYSQAGTYTVSLTVTNEAGSDTETLSLNVRQGEPAICRDLGELNSVYFGRNSSTLTPEGRLALDENVDVLRECPRIDVRIEGWAAPGERNPRQLSEDRARGVEQYYLSRDIARGRMEIRGMGAVSGLTSKKDGTQRYQRADTIPLR